jgi:hypothetical protein
MFVVDINETLNETSKTSLYVSLLQTRPLSGARWGGCLKARLVVWLVGGFLSQRKLKRARRWLCIAGECDCRQTKGCCDGEQAKERREMKATVVLLISLLRWR